MFYILFFLNLVGTVLRTVDRRIVTGLVIGVKRNAKGTSMINYGGRAFPLSATDQHGCEPGMSLRMWLAGQALTNPGIIGVDSCMDEAADRCFLYADALILERNREEEVSKN